MQLIDDTKLAGVRSAVMTLERRDSPVRFVTIPMMHVGLPRFYDDVQRILADCDVIVAEGVSSRRVKLITSSYRIAAHFRTGGLVLQSEGLDLAALSGEVIQPDMTAQQFDADWSSIRPWWRALILLAAPIFGLWLAILGPDRVLRGSMTMDDLASYDEATTESPFDELILHARDRLLCAELVRLASEPRDQPITVGVPWGAHHMRAVIATLSGELGYRITDAEWIKIL